MSTDRMRVQGDMGFALKFAAGMTWSPVFAPHVEEHGHVSDAIMAVGRKR